MKAGLYEAAFANSPIGQVIVEADGKILKRNRSFTGLVDRYRLKSFANITQPLISAHKKVSRDRFSVLARAQGRSEWLVRLDTPADHVVWRFDVSVIGSDHGVRLLLVSVRDVSLEKRNEQRLKAAKEAAERATETKSAFLANMSHEIRTPIHTITGMTELLAETSLDEEQREYANQVRFSAEVLLFLINDILDFSKIEAGKLIIESIEFSPGEVVEESVEMVSMRAHRKGVETIVSVAPGVPQRVLGDPGRLRQVIINLASNAVKFTAAGQIEVRVSVSDYTDGAASLLFEVEDTGIGVPPDKQAALFQAFSQIDSTTTRRFGGTGLGLSISKSLVEMMGGRIGLRSELDRGSCFWFEIPMEIVAGSLPQEDLFEGVRALLVDDNNTSSQVIGTYLRSWGAEVDIVASGEQCVSSLASTHAAGTPYDITLIDLELPGMDGWQLASTITHDDKTGDVSLVLMSPVGLLAGEAKMKRLHWFNAYVRKPIRRAELIDAIKEATMDLPELLPAEEAPESGQLSEPRNGRVVVAEDHDVNQALFRTILERLGHTVILAADGNQAIEAAETNDVDLVFMDVQMPEKNGYQAAQELRTRGFRKPIIAVTANAVKGEREKCLGSGMNDFLPKPFKKQDLVPLLERWLEVSIADGAADEAVLDVEPDDEPHYGDEGFSLPESVLGRPIQEDPRVVFDRESALDRFMGKSEIVMRVAKEFITKHRAILPKMKADAEASRFGELQEAAHALKGGAWNLDAVFLGNLAAFTEAGAKLGDASVCIHYVEKMESAMDEFEQAIGQ